MRTGAAELLEFVRANLATHGFSPTVKEIETHLGIGERRRKRLVAELVEGGLVRRRQHAPGFELIQTEQCHGPKCKCDPCVGKRDYLNRLQLVHGVRNDPPAHLRLSPASNIRFLSDRKRADLLGVSPGDHESTGSMAAPRTRAQAFPSEAS